MQSTAESPHPPPPNYAAGAGPASHRLAKAEQRSCGGVSGGEKEEG